MSYNHQYLFGPSHVATAAITLKAPLRRLWTVPGRFDGVPLTADSGTLVTRGENDRELVLIDRSGQDSWRLPGAFGINVAMSRAQVYGTHRGLLYLIGLADGTVLRRTTCEVDLQTLLPERGQFVGCRWGEGVTPSRVALVDLTDATSRWQRSLAQLRDSGVCDSDHVYVVSGEDVIALGLDDGDEVWRTDLTPLGGLMGMIAPQPMVAENKVVVRTRTGTVAFDAQSGQTAWYYDEGGWRMIYDGRVYMVDQAYFTILELQNGRELLRVRVLDEIERKWGLDDVGISTGLLVSETHAFFGDGAGRLFAVERDTGEPVWFDRPKGTRGYLGAIPAVAGNRLYITTFSVDPKRPGQLHCYESAESP